MLMPFLCARALPWLALACLASCSSRSRPQSLPSETVTLAGIHHGQLVDVYGITETNGQEVLQLHARDLLVGHTLPGGDELRAYELLAANATSGKPRVAIRFPVATPAFDAALAKLRAGVRELPLTAAGGTREVPQGAAIELRFTANLGLEAGVFDPAGAIQIADSAGQPLPARVVALGDRLVIAPTLRSDERESLSLTLGGPALPRVDGLTLGFTAVPAAAANRSLQNPPRLVGELGFFLERVDELNEGVQQATLFKNGISHDIDAGDELQLFVQGSVAAVVVTEVIADPADDDGRPAVQHVRTRVFRSNLLERIDPSNLPGYPSNPQSPAGEAWLVANAPRAVLVTEYQAEQQGALGTVQPRDDLRNFVTFTPAPLPAGQPTPPNENVSPHAGAIVRFSAPINMVTARPLDTLFFATRDLLDPAEQLAFAQMQGIDPSTFNPAKFFTPHLVHSRLFELSGQQSVLRVQPPLGFYLDEVMRRIDEGQPFANKRFKYYLHIVGGRDGITGANGMPLDFGYLGAPRDYATLPFSLDTRTDTAGRPLFPDNRVASVARRFANRDEDEQPSYYQSSEVQLAGSPFNPKAFELADLFGAVIYLADGTLGARPTSRIRQIVDDLNQAVPPPQTSALRFCPSTFGPEEQVAIPTTGQRFGSPLQTPLNPYGSRTQSAWREIDMSLARTDPNDFNLDVEAMYWAPFSGPPLIFDEFARVSLFLGHSENRPEPCLGTFSALPTMPGSGLAREFADNYVADRDPAGNPVPGPAPHAAFADQLLVIDPAKSVFEPNGIYRYLPLPTFEAPYFVWRDERVMQQGGSAHAGNDAKRGGYNYQPYVLSPFLAGRGRYVTSGTSGQPQFNIGAWDNRENFSLAQPTRPDTFTDGLVGSIGLPLLMDFWTFPSASSNGLNGWQISLAVNSSWHPSFRAYSSGGLVQGSPVTVSPTTPGWQVAEGGYTPLGQRTRSDDNAVYWVMADFLKQMSVATAGFVDITDPHRVPATVGDPRLGPYFPGGLPRGTSAFFTYDVTPAGEGQVPGTQVAVEFRGAGAVDPQPWAAVVNGYNSTSLQEQPDPSNFPLDPMKAADAHIRKFDDRPGMSTPPRNTWTRYYNEIVTDYTSDPNQLMDPGFTAAFAGPGEQFLPEDVRYFNWRFIMQNAPDRLAGAPRLESFALSYRLQ